MDDQEREMEIIALLSNIDDTYTYIDCDREIIEHSCEKTHEQREIRLIDIEYFKDARLREDKANFCEHCNQVFVYKP
jgi:hypothetical protein